MTGGPVKTHTIDDEIRIPIRLRDEDGLAHVRAVFRRMRQPGGLGPRGLDADDTLELRGNGGNETETEVEVTIKVADEHTPGEYLCVAIQVYDALGNMVMIENPSPAKIFRIVDERKRDDNLTEFLGWGDK